MEKSELPSNRIDDLEAHIGRMGVIEGNPPDRRDYYEQIQTRYFQDGKDRRKKGPSKWNHALQGVG